MADKSFKAVLNQLKFVEFLGEPNYSYGTFFYRVKEEALCYLMTILENPKVV